MNSASFGFISISGGVHKSSVHTSGEFQGTEPPLSIIPERDGRPGNLSGMRDSPFSAAVDEKTVMKIKGYSRCAEEKLWYVSCKMRFRNRWSGRDGQFGGRLIVRFENCPVGGWVAVDRRDDLSERAGSSVHGSTS